MIILCFFFFFLSVPYYFRLYCRVFIISKYKAYTRGHEKKKPNRRSERGKRLIDPWGDGLRDRLKRDLTDGF